MLNSPLHIGISDKWNKGMIEDAHWQQITMPCMQATVFLGEHRLDRLSTVQLPASLTLQVTGLQST